MVETQKNYVLRQKYGFSFVLGVLPIAETPKVIRHRPPFSFLFSFFLLLCRVFFCDGSDLGKGLILLKVILR